MRKLLVKTAGKFIFLISVLLFVATNYAYAEGVPGSAGDIKPLSFISCTLEDGNKVDGVEIANMKPKFTLQFDKNVVNMLVWENNRKSVSILADNNASVPADVSKIDDTVDFDHRQQIFVQPVNQLEPGKTYFIKVSPMLVAKNGVATLGETTGGQGITISFRTKKSEVAQAVSPAEVNNSPLAASQQPNEVKTSDNNEKAVSQVNTLNNQKEASGVSASNGTIQKNTSEATKKSAIYKSNEVTASEQPEVNENVSKDNLQADETPAAESQHLMGSLDSNSLINLFIAVLIILWILIEFSIKRKKKQGSTKLKL